MHLLAVGNCLRCDNIIRKMKFVLVMIMLIKDIPCSASHYTGPGLNFHYTINACSFFPLDQIIVFRKNMLLF